MMQGMSCSSQSQLIRLNCKLEFQLGQKEIPNSLKKQEAREKETSLAKSSEKMQMQLQLAVLTERVSMEQGKKVEQA